MKPRKNADPLQPADEQHMSQHQSTLDPEIWILSCTEPKCCPNLGTRCSSAYLPSRRNSEVLVPEPQTNRLSELRRALQRASGANGLPRLDNVRDNAHQLADAKRTRNLQMSKHVELRGKRCFPMSSGNNTDKIHFPHVFVNLGSTSQLELLPPRPVGQQGVDRGPHGPYGASLSCLKEV